MNLTKNFTLEELCPNSTIRATLSSTQMEMLSAIATNILQPIRNILGRPIGITSAVRSSYDYNRLRAAGYNPSETSDHYYGFPVEIINSNKITKFGKTYSYSVGAVDFTVLGMNNSDIYRIIYDMCNRKKLAVGQLIHEYGNGMDWIHISNPPTLIYSESFCSKYLNKGKFLVSSDAGKTYSNYA